MVPVPVLSIGSSIGLVLGYVGHTVGRANAIDLLARDILLGPGLLRTKSARGFGRC